MLGDMHWQPDQHPFSTVQKYTSEGDLQALINTSSTEPEANAEEQMSDG